MTGTGGFGRDEDRDDFGAQSVAQLDLDDEDERLPWLESAGDEDEQGVDTGRLVSFALIGFLALAVLVGLIWWLGNSGSDPEAVADGGTIAAPQQPYKSKPDDPGGTEFAGTGDTSFKVGEGERTDGRLADRPAPGPSLDVGQAVPPAPVKAVKTMPAAAATAETGGGLGVQVGAYTSREGAQAGWNRLVGANEALQGYSHRIVQGQADIGTVYRLQAVVGSAAEAESLCARLKAAGTACQVKR